MAFERSWPCLRNELSKTGLQGPTLIVFFATLMPERENGKEHIPAKAEQGANYGWFSNIGPKVPCLDVDFCVQMKIFRNLNFRDFFQVLYLDDLIWSSTPTEQELLFPLVGEGQGIMYAKCSPQCLTHVEGVTSIDEKSRPPFTWHVFIKHLLHTMHGSKGFDTAMNK